MGENLNTKECAIQENYNWKIFSLNTISEGRVAIGEMSGFLPCTPNGW